MKEISRSVTQIPRGESHRSPELHVALRKAELSRHHSDNCVRPVIEEDLAAEHSRVGSKTLRPEGVTQKHSTWRVGTILGFCKHATQLRTDTKQRKSFGGNRDAFHTFGVALPLHRCR